MSGPYDYPGEFALRFDGVESNKWCGYFASWNQSEGRQPLRILKLRVSDPWGKMQIRQWQSATTPAGGPPKTLIIEGLNRARVPVARWRVLNARPTSWLAGASTGSHEAAIEKVELTHEAILRIR